MAVYYCFSDDNLYLEHFVASFWFAANSLKYFVRTLLYKNEIFAKQNGRPDFHLTFIQPREDHRKVLEVSRSRKLTKFDGNSFGISNTCRQISRQVREVSLFEHSFDTETLEQMSIDSNSHIIRKHEN